MKQLFIGDNPTQFFFWDNSDLAYEWIHSQILHPDNIFGIKDQESCLVHFSGTEYTVYDGCGDGYVKITLRDLETVNLGQYDYILKSKNGGIPVKEAKSMRAILKYVRTFVNVPDSYFVIRRNNKTGEVKEYPAEPEFLKTIV